MGLALWLLWIGCSEPVVLPLLEGPEPGFTEGDDSIQWEELSAALDDSAAFYWIDARPRPDFLFLHAAGAVHVPFFAVGDHVERLPSEAWYVVYAGDHAEPVDRVLRVLRKDGFDRVLGTALDLRDLVDLGVATGSGAERAGRAGTDQELAPDSGPPQADLPDGPS